MPSLEVKYIVYVNGSSTFTVMFQKIGTNNAQTRPKKGYNHVQEASVISGICVILPEFISSSTTFHGF